MDENNILMPDRWTKTTIAARMTDLYETLGRMPTSMDDRALAGHAKRKFGSWNQALMDVFGSINQARYDSYANEELLNILQKFIDDNGRVPRRDEFDGKKYPYFEAYFHRFSKNKWGDIIMMVDTSRAKLSKHGFGRVYVHNGIKYLSHGEYLIGKYLSDNNIAFEKEVPYENCGAIFDFFLPELNVYIEYYGIATPDYKARIAYKQSKYAGRRVIEIFKHDNTLKKLDSEVQRL